MQPLLASLTSWTAIVAPIVTIVGLIQSRGWLAGIGALFACISIAAILYARSQRLRVEAATVEIEGISIDSLNAASLRRRVSDRFMIQTVQHVVTIGGGDLEVDWCYAGYCRVDRATAFDFSIDSSTNTPFRELDCYGYDLKNDPQQHHRIQPLLIGPDSISKKISLPFLEPLRVQQPFDVRLHCRMPSTYKLGTCYYTSTLSFDQKVVDRCTVKLIFRGEQPEWVRVYQYDPGASPLLVRSLSAARQHDGSVEYSDDVENRNARSARVYLFQRAKA